MLPRWHILFGAIFTFILYYFSPRTPKLFLFLVFFASFLIDFDHYICAVLKTGRISLFDAFDYHKEMLKKEEQEIKKRIRRKGDDFHFFHTIEFHILIAILGIYWIEFFYIFIGMIFHSLLDVCSSLYTERFHRREYFFFNWVGRKLFK